MEVHREHKDHVFLPLNPPQLKKGVEDGFRESTESWSEVLRDLKRRGLQPPVLAVADGVFATQRIEKNLPETSGLKRNSSDAGSPTGFNQTQTETGRQNFQKM